MKTHVQLLAKQQTPFRKVKSPGSPKHMKEKVREKRKGEKMVASKEGGSEAT